MAEKKEVDFAKSVDRLFAASDLLWPVDRVKFVEPTDPFSDLEAATACSQHDQDNAERSAGAEDTAASSTRRTGRFIMLRGH